MNGRILKDLQPGGYDLTVLPDRKWVQLTDKVRVQCITTRIQDSILLVDSCGSLFINTNDAGTRDCTRYIRSIASRYERSYLLALSGYGDADMINFFDEQGNFLTPRAARKPSVGGQLTNLAKAAGAKAVIPFSAFHQYQRTDSMWAEAYTTPMDAFEKGLSPDVGFVPAFSTVDCRDGSFTSGAPEEIAVVPKAPEEFGDNWSDVLEAADVKKIEAYFARKDPVQDYFGFVNFRVGGRDHAIGMRGPKERGISFAVPRGSLMTCIDYRIFDDLLIGNYMKTTLHGGVRSLQEGGFNYYVAKYGDNGAGRDRCRAAGLSGGVPPARGLRLHRERARGQVARLRHALRRAGFPTLQARQVDLREDALSRITFLPIQMGWCRRLTTTEGSEVWRRRA